MLQQKILSFSLPNIQTLPPSLVIVIFCRELTWHTVNSSNRLTTPQPPSPKFELFIIARCSILTTVQYLPPPVIHSWIKTHYSKLVLIRMYRITKYYTLQYIFSDFPCWLMFHLCQYYEVAKGEPNTKRSILKIDDRTIFMKLYFLHGLLTTSSLLISQEERRWSVCHFLILFQILPHWNQMIHLWYCWMSQHQSHQGKENNQRGGCSKWPQQTTCQSC